MNPTQARAPRLAPVRSRHSHRSSRPAHTRLAVVGACAGAAVTSMMIGPSA